MITSNTATITVSQGETSNYNSGNKSIIINLSPLAIQGRRPVFLRGL
jgi:hypothetical protein